MTEGFRAPWPWEGGGEPYERPALDGFGRFGYVRIMGYWIAGPREGLRCEHGHKLWEIVSSETGHKLWCPACRRELRGRIEPRSPN
jgi:hypothetical protein